MRMMDDIIDLELEKVEQIIAKIAADPEDEEVRRVELELWKKILTMAQKGRRTGLGITAEGDMLAALGVYGSERRSLSPSRCRRRWPSKPTALRSGWPPSAERSRSTTLRRRRTTR